MVDDDFIASFCDARCHQTNMKRLTLRLCLNLTKASLENILVKLSNIECLDISGCTNIELVALDKAHHAKKLKWLNMELMNPSGSDLINLSQCKQGPPIQILSLRSCLSLCDDSAKQLSRLSNLKQVNLENCPKLTPEILKYLSQKFNQDIEICI